MSKSLYLGPVAGAFAKPHGQQVDVGDTLRVEAEPSNKYDTRAVAVFYNAGQVGYIPRKDTAVFHTALAAGKKPVGVVLKWEWPNRSLVQWEAE